MLDPMPGPDAATVGLTATDITVSQVVSMASRIPWDDMAWVESTPTGERFKVAMAPRGVMLNRQPGGGDLGEELVGFIAQGVVALTLVTDGLFVRRPSRKYGWQSWSGAPRALLGCSSFSAWPSPRR